MKGGITGILKVSLLVFWLLAGVTFAQDPPGTRVLRPAPQSVTVPYDATEFRKLYRENGAPDIAVFWNRQFSDTLTQWQVNFISNRERSISSRSNSSVADDSSGNCILLIQAADSADCEFSAREFDEQRVSQDRGVNSTGFTSDLQSYRFNAGFTQSMVNEGVSLIDRNFIIRMLESRQRTEGSARAIPDYYQLETDALIGQADLVAEINLGGNPSNLDAISFMVSIKSVSTGRILAMLVVDGGNSVDAQGRTEWVVSGDGYEQVTIFPSDNTLMQNIGQAIAEETMRALARYWSNA